MNVALNDNNDISLSAFSLTRVKKMIIQAATIEIFCYQRHHHRFRNALQMLQDEIVSTNSHSLQSVMDKNENQKTQSAIPAAAYKATPHDAPNGTRFHNANFQTDRYILSHMRDENHRKTAQNALKLPLPVGDFYPHLVYGSFGPPESLTQTESRSVQPLLQKCDQQQYAASTYCYDVD